MDTPARPKHRRLELRLIGIDGSPMRKKACMLSWGPTFAESGATDDDGVVAWNIPLKPQEGELFIEAHKPGKTTVTYEIAITKLGTGDLPSTKARLNNLGFLSLKGSAASALSSTLDDATRRALQRFRMANGISPAQGVPGGRLDDAATLTRLVDAHDDGGAIGKV